MRYVVFTEIHQNEKIERWYYGIYSSIDKANNVAYELGQNREEGVYHCVCDEDQMFEFKIKNIPDKLLK